MMSIYIYLYQFVLNMFWWSLRMTRGSLQIVFIASHDRSRKRRGPNGVAWRRCRFPNPIPFGTVKE